MVHPVLLLAAVLVVAACKPAKDTPRSSAQVLQGESPSVDSGGEQARPEIRDISDCRGVLGAVVPHYPPGSSFAVEGYDCPEAAVLWLNERTEADVDGDPLWELRHAVEAEPLKPGELFVEYFYRYQQTLDQTIVAIAVYQDKPLFENIRAAWRANLDSRQFEELPAQEVTCDNEGYGV